jgi:succinate-semialdehyde dehydrogenase/glutarate-semialdehyde dehydrogenase
MTITNTHLGPAELLSTVPTGLFIGGQWRPAEDGATFAVDNPATGGVIADVSDAGIADAQAAVDAAAAAQTDWAATSPRQRADILRRAYDLLLERADDLALIMTSEMGKPLAEAKAEVSYAAEFFRWFSEEAPRIDGSYGQTPDGNTRVLVMRRPVGPCLLITPWNFPMAMGTRKIGPAIAAGCTMVFKPAPQTPLSSLALAALLTEAGLPDGVLNVIPTSRAEQIIEPIMTGGVLRKMSFTGSTEVGRILLARAARTVMRTSMELGGNAPFIVFDDADLDTAVDAAFAAKMRNMGEACTAANRIFAQRGVAEQFTSRLADRMAGLIVGDGTEDGVQVGPLIDQPSLNKVSRLVEDALSKGARIVAQGQVPDTGGYFYPPTVLTDIAANSELLHTEIFGPVAAVRTFDTEAEVLTAANDTDWGLVGYVVTNDLNRALRVSEALEVGMVGLNTGIVSNPAAPFGGVKQSGLGREGGRVGIDEFLEYRYLAIPSR